MTQSQRKKILVLGGDGMAGHMISAVLEQEYEVHVTTRREGEHGQRIFFDGTNPTTLDDICNTINPDVVVNCIGILNNVAEEHKDLAVRINAYLPQYCNTLAQKFDFRFIHISTDCVFSGEKGGYVESDLPDATSFYGRSKALGEVDSEKSVTLRTSIIGPDLNPNGVGLLNWFMAQNGDINGFTKAIWSGVTTYELAKVVGRVISSPSLQGLCHITNNQSIDKYALLLLMKEAFDRDDIVVVPKDEYVSDKSLVSLREDADFSLPSYEKMVSDLSQWICDHSDLYPHYKKNHA